MRPLFIFVLVAVSMTIGYYLPQLTIDNSQLRRNTKKISDLLRIIDEYYVDAVDADNLTEEGIKAILHKLDPHSSYVSSMDTQLEMAHIKGGFEGIGVSFYIFADSVVVENTLPDGPARRAGILPGDRMIAVDGEPFFPKETREVIEKLRGEKGSRVEVEVFRQALGGSLKFALSRGSIATSAIEAAFMLSDNLGYIRLSKFSSNCSQEVRERLIDLKNKGMTKLIFDVQGNGGGLLDQAILIADEFLTDSKLIVYTQGKNARNDRRYFAKNSGAFENGDIWVLIDESSASASEILAGALQDNDRAVLVGRRTFGKGLVQRPVTFEDGSMLKITVSRYYTPSGRCIQKPYTSHEAYSTDLLKRIETGEYFLADSIKHDSTQTYKTQKGRIVFGGGGISPDFFVAKDTSSYTPLIGEIFAKSIVREVAAQEAKRLQMDENTFIQSYQFDNFKLLSKIAAQVGTDMSTLKSIPPVLASQIKAQIARVKYGEDAFYKAYLQRDPVFNKALQLSR